jgi:hypothetical protein
MPSRSHDRARLRRRGTAGSGVASRSLEARASRAMRRSIGLSFGAVTLLTLACAGPPSPPTRALPHPSASAAVSSGSSTLGHLDWAWFRGERDRCINRAVLSREGDRLTIERNDRVLLPSIETWDVARGVLLNWTGPIDWRGEGPTSQHVLDRVVSLRVTPAMLPHLRSFARTVGATVRIEGSRGARDGWPAVRLVRGPRREGRLASDASHHLAARYRRP